MNRTRHENILSALEHRAMWNLNNGKLMVDADATLYENALDETGTVATAILTDTDDSESDAESYHDNRLCFIGGVGI